jgi:hypothetical protein
MDDRRLEKGEHADAAARGPIGDVGAEVVYATSGRAFRFEAICEGGRQA